MRHQCTGTTRRGARCRQPVAVAGTTCYQCRAPQPNVYRAVDSTQPANHLRQTVAALLTDRATTVLPADTDVPTVARLAPSKLWDVARVAVDGGCPRHLWDAHHLGLKPPFRPMPGLFGVVDRGTRAAVQGRTTDSVLGEEALRTAPGVFENGRRMSCVVRTPNGRYVELAGVADATIAHDDGTVSVVDYKCAPVGGNMAAKSNRYKYQLLAYRAMLEAEGRTVAGQAILWTGPQAKNTQPVACHEGTFELSGYLSMVPVAGDTDDLGALLDSYCDLIETDTRPPCRDDCDQCEHETALIAASH